jgi:hypothetical protein
MKIGLDLDNTIVDCDALFQRRAEQLLGRSLDGRAREDIRRLVRETLGDPCWTQIQAEVYGPLYQECPPFPQALETIAKIARCAHTPEIFIISHKTVTDSAGKKYKLRDYARKWVARHLIGEQTRLSDAHVFFTETIEEKRHMIVDMACDVFFDDLPSIILPLQDIIPHAVLFSRSSADNHPLKTSVHVCDWPAFGAFICNG